MVFDYHGYALGPGGDNFPDGRNFIQRGHGHTVVKRELFSVDIYSVWVTSTSRVGPCTILILETRKMSVFQKQCIVKVQKY